MNTPGLRVECQESLVVLENVEAFPTPVLFRALSKYYVIADTLMDPRQFGLLCYYIGKLED